MFYILFSGGSLYLYGSFGRCYTAYPVRVVSERVRIPDRRQKCVVGVIPQSFRHTKKKKAHNSVKNCGLRWCWLCDL